MYSISIQYWIRTLFATKGESYELTLTSSAWFNWPASCCGMSRLCLIDLGWRQVERNPHIKTLHFHFQCYCMGAYIFTVFSLVVDYMLRHYWLTVQWNTWYSWEILSQVAFLQNTWWFPLRVCFVFLLQCSCLKNAIKDYCECWMCWTSIDVFSSLVSAVNSEV